MAGKLKRSGRSRIISVHRWLGLGAAIFWLVQALTGMAIMFHWEIRDASIADLHRATDLAAIERRIDALAPAGSDRSVGSMWTSAGFPDRYDLYVSEANGTSYSVRIAGDGTILRRKADGEDGLIDILVNVHHNLNGGDFGGWIVGISGLLLLTNLIAGLIVAWPRRGTWRIALRPSNRGPATAKVYSWHRALGLWMVAPAMIVAATGTMMVFQGGLGTLIGAETDSLPANPKAADRPVGFARAAGAALAAIPGSTLTAVVFPTAEDATYQIRVLAPGEIRRAYGASQIFVDANDGHVRGVFPSSEARPAQAFIGALFPIHTGEIGGLGGRFFALLTGGWLAIMIMLGALLWLRRRPKGKTS